MDAARLRRYVIAIVFGWTIILSVILAHEIQNMREYARELARNEARVHFKWITTFRSWVASHGGVYAPQSQSTPPNEWLKVKDRDIDTPSGKKLTMINPAYMTRQIFEQYAPAMKIKGHITSLNLLRPQNAPDDWERASLESFERGETENFEFTQIDGKPYLRLMRPLYIQEVCLKCHGHQGYKKGDVRGGISVSAPMESYLAYERMEIIGHTVNSGLVWVLGLMAITVGARRIGRQIKDREAAEEQKKLLKASIENAADMVVITDIKGDILYVNPAYEKITGYSRDEAIGNNPRILNSGRQDQQFYESLWRTISSGNNWKGRFVNKSKNGKIFEAEATISPVTSESGDITGYSAIMKDVSREALLSRAREFFAYSASHELRNPLTKLTLAQLLFESVTENVPHSEHIEKSKEVLGEVSSEIEKVITSTTMLTDLVSGIKAPQRPFNLLSVLELYIEYAKRGADGEMRRVTINTDISAMPKGTMINGAQDMIQKAFEETLSNAIKYTPDGGEVSITAETTDELAIITISDKGIGIEIDDYEKLFDPFFSIENIFEHTSGKYRFRGSGIGLGLTITRMITDYHGGEIEIQSDGVDKGTTVTLTFPLKK